MNCSTCDANKPKTRINCKIKNCEILRKNDWKFCSDKCKEFPCCILKNLDKRYKEKYGMSMIANLESIEKGGIRKFIDGEKEKWVKGNKIFCIHDKKYYVE